MRTSALVLTNGAPERVAPPKTLAVRLSELFTFAAVRPARNAAERLIRKYAPQGEATFFDPSTFPWMRELEANYPVIRAELDAVLSESQPIPDFSELSPAQGTIVHGKGWKSFFLFLTRRRITEGCRRCPRTAELLSRIPGIESAFFSVLEPGTHLTAHRGPYGGVLRYHLGLVVPSDATLCRLRVGDDVAHWQEGQSLVFDDSHDHEAWNRSDERRVVLFVDFERPLPPLLSRINACVLRLIARAAFIEELRKNLAVAGASAR